MSDQEAKSADSVGPTRQRIYLIREAHVLGFLLGSVLTKLWPLLAGAWLLVAVALWLKSMKDADA